MATISSCFGIVCKEPRGSARDARSESSPVGFLLCLQSLPAGAPGMHAVNPLLWGSFFACNAFPRER